MKFRSANERIEQLASDPLIAADVERYSDERVAWSGTTGPMIIGPNPWPGVPDDFPAVTGVDPAPLFDDEQLGLFYLTHNSARAGLSEYLSLDDLVVEDGYRSRGLGSELLAAVLPVRRRSAATGAVQGARFRFGHGRGDQHGAADGLVPAVWVRRSHSR